MMQINLLWIYITVPLAGFVWTVFTLFRLWQLIRDYRGRNQVSS